MENNKLYYFHNVTGYFFDSTEVTANEVKNNNDMLELGFDDMTIDWVEYWANVEHNLKEDGWEIEIDMNINDYTLYMIDQPVSTGDLIEVLDILAEFVYEWECYHDKDRIKEYFNIK